MQVLGVGLEDSVAEKFAKTVLGLCAKKMNKMWLTKVFEGFIESPEVLANALRQNSMWQTSRVGSVLSTRQKPMLQ
jgi:hypothetical protein